MSLRDDYMRTAQRMSPRFLHVYVVGSVFLPSIMLFRLLTDGGRWYEWVAMIALYLTGANWGYVWWLQSRLRRDERPAR